MLLTAEMTQRQLYDQSPYQHGSWFTKAETLELTAQCTDCLASCRVSFSGSSDSLSLLEASCFVRERLSAILAVYLCLGREEPSMSGQFQGLPEVSELFGPLQELPCRKECITTTSPSSCALRNFSPSRSFILK